VSTPEHADWTDIRTAFEDARRQKGKKARKSGRDISYLCIPLLSIHVQLAGKKGEIIEDTARQIARSIGFLHSAADCEKGREKGEVLPAGEKQRPRPCCCGTQRFAARWGRKKKRDDRRA